MMEIKKNKGVFIIGMPRSGTTLVSSLINASDNIYIGVETHIFPIYEKWIKQGSKKINFTEYYFSYSNNPYLQYFNFKKAEINKIKLSINNKNSIESILAQLNKIQNKNQAVKEWGEKTPRHYEHLEQIRHFFKDCKIIIIKRDPRDIFLSQKKIKWGTKNPLEFVIRYKRFQRIVHENKEKKDVFVLKYEEVLSNSKDNLEKLYDFLEISFDENLISNFSNLKYQNYSKVLEPWKNNNGGSLLKTNFNKWKSDVEDKDIQFISFFLRKGIDSYGYDPGFQLSRVLFIVLFCSYFIKSMFSKLWLKSKNLNYR